MVDKVLPNEKLNKLLTRSVQDSQAIPGDAQIGAVIDDVLEHLSTQLASTLGRRTKNPMFLQIVSSLGGIRMSADICRHDAYMLFRKQARQTLTDPQSRYASKWSKSNRQEKADLITQLTNKKLSKQNHICIFFGNDKMMVYKLKPDVGRKKIVKLSDPQWAQKLAQVLMTDIMGHLLSETETAKLRQAQGIKVKPELNA